SAERCGPIRVRRRTASAGGAEERGASDGPAVEWQCGFDVLFAALSIFRLLLVSRRRRSEQAQPAAVCRRRGSRADPAGTVSSSCLWLLDRLVPDRLVTHIFQGSVH